MAGSGFHGVAFLKQTDSLLGTLVRWRTGSIYSHCELVLDGGLGRPSQCFSSSFSDGGVRVKQVTLDPLRWDIVPASLDMGRVAGLIGSECGKSYDRLGLLFWGWPVPIQDKTKWFCAELVATALGWKEPWTLSPGSIAQRLTGEWR